MPNSLDNLHLIPEHFFTIGKTSISSIKFPTLQLEQTIDFHCIELSIMRDFDNLSKGTTS